MRKILLLIVLSAFGICAYSQKAQQTQQILKKSTVTKLYTCALDEVLDTLAMDYHLHIVFERDSLHKFDIVEHFFNDPLKNVIEKIVGENNLHYWIESDGTIYILQNTDDLARLKKLNSMRTAINGIPKPQVEPAKAPP